MPEHLLHVPLIAVLPFVLMLASIAIMPLAAPHFWDHNRNKGIFAAVLGIPVAIWLISHNPIHLAHVLHEYVSFICLLGSLFIVAGGIHLGGDLRATPRNNTIILAIGGILASIIGTTGASMVMIRLLLRTNSERHKTGHLPFFFILIVSNAGGLLTPLGDPPLFLGFLRGVPFFWTMKLLPIWVLGLAYLLIVFFIVDRKAYGKETLEDLVTDERQVVPLQAEGMLNILWLVVVVLSVFIPTPYREIVMVLAALASLKFGRQTGREKNEFNFGPIIEVAVLFIGIFVTMVPALLLLEQKGPELGLFKPWHFFLVSGALSSVLDNAPTYLTFFTTAQATAASLHLPTAVVGIPANLLAAISAGSVLMGANTYIGNGPNFMVKAIADSSGYKTMSFFHYAFWAILTLLPLYFFTAWLLPHY
nr:sodium:proton antiporter [uncultured Holophaga sp.]